jgi:hypothetical protein
MTTSEFMTQLEDMAAGGDYPGIIAFCDAHLDEVADQLSEEEDYEVRGVILRRAHIVEEGRRRREERSAKVSPLLEVNGAGPVRLDPDTRV